MNKQNKEHLRTLKEFEDYYARLHPNERRNITQLVWGTNGDKRTIWPKVDIEYKKYGEGGGT